MTFTGLFSSALSPARHQPWLKLTWQSSETFLVSPVAPLRKLWSGTVVLAALKATSRGSAGDTFQIPCVAET
jgi:hypothetical protein